MDCGEVSVDTEPTPDTGAIQTLPQYQPQALRKLQREDPEIGRFVYWKEIGRKSNLKELKFENKNVKLLRKWENILDVDGVWYKMVNDPLLGENKQLLVSQQLRQLVLHQLHDVSGHQGSERTTALVTAICYWPGVQTDIQHCERCTVAKAPMPKIKPPIGNVLAGTPLEMLVILVRL